MIANDAKSTIQQTTSSWQDAFLAMLPQIEAQIGFAFRHLVRDAREEAMQEAIANCCVSYERLNQQGRAAVASPTSLAQFAIRQVRAGRTTGTPLNIRDPLSRYAQLNKSIGVERLDHYCRETDEWLPILIEDHRISVAEQAALRIDIPAWLNRFTRRTRQIARDLALGFSTSEIASHYHLSPARISQMRREFHEAWLKFHGLEKAEPAAA